MIFNSIEVPLIELPYHIQNITLNYVSICELAKLFREEKTI